LKPPGHSFDSHHGRETDGVLNSWKNIHRASCVISMRTNQTQALGVWLSFFLRAFVVNAFYPALFEYM
jgi:hypothetical protein